MSKNTERIYVSLHTSQVEYINKEAERVGVQSIDIIRRAINTDKYIEEQMAAGSRILIEAPDKSIKEVVFR